MIRAALAPLLRELDIAHLRWALKELNPAHPDVPRIVVRLRDRLAERYATPCYLRRTWQWL